MDDITVGHPQQQGALRRWLQAALFGATVLAIAGVAVVTLYHRAASKPELEPRPPITVEVAPLELADSYSVQESFLGRIEPARESALAFERAGLVVEIVAEEGDRVTTGDVLARVDTAPLRIERERLTAERAAIEAEIELAQRTEARRALLVDDGWASGQAYDEARLSHAALSARRDTLDAGLARVDLDIEKSEIRAPFSGVVTARTGDEGVVMSAGTPLLHLEETARPQARIGVPADRIYTLSKGQDLDLAYRGKRLRGRVAAIRPDLATGTRTVAVLVDLDPSASVTMGEVVRLHMAREIAGRGAWLPLSALEEAERGLWSILTVVDTGSGRQIRREVVELIHVAGERAFVRGSFPDGADVVLEGRHRLAPEQPVEIRQSRTS